MKLRLLIVAMITLDGCANPINLHTAREYAQGGYSSIKQDKWFNGRMSFGRAWANAELGKADDNVIAVYAYEYGRTSGAICDWKESERGLQKAYELDTKTNGPVHMSMAELARMYHAVGDMEQSKKWFALAKNELDRLQADTRDSIGYANILAEYAEVLSSLGDVNGSAALRKREYEIRSVFEGRSSSHEQTPYGKYCDQDSLTIKASAPTNIANQKKSTGTTP